MFRKIKERIRAPEVDRKELEWLKEQLNPAPAHPELMEVDDNIRETEVAEFSDVEDYEPPRKKVSPLN